MELKTQLVIGGRPLVVSATRDDGDDESFCVRFSLDGAPLRAGGFWKPGEGFIDDAPDELADEAVNHALAAALERRFTEQPMLVYSLRVDPERDGAHARSWIGGLPRGMDSSQWPRWRSRPLTHVMTVSAELLDSVWSAASVFVSLFPEDREDLFFGLGCEVVLHAHECWSAPPTPAPDDWPTTHEIECLALAGDLLEATPSECARLRQYSGGAPSFLQPHRRGDEGAFLFQLDATLVPLNLGDNGVMYVFTRGLFAQSC